VVRTAVRGRRRQYEARNHLEELAHEREALSELTATLEQRVKDRTAELEGEVRTREQVQDQLLQSQKMESIGKLTGGVAHDFNNLLMAVMGNLELLRKRLPADTRAQRLIDAAMQGAELGAALTQRMLAFARQQDLKTSSSDLEALVLGMRELLERTLGSNVEVRFDISTNTAKILVVDDDPLIAMSTVDMLEDLGHTVIRASSGKRALELLEIESAVDVLMTDQAMPGMTGLELAKIARSKWPKLRVLLATGYADLPRHEKTDLPRLSKPYHQAQLQAEINRLLADQQ
jgi:CheY-like chemotaxis protein